MSKLALTLLIVGALFTAIQSRSAQKLVSQRVAYGELGRPPVVVMRDDSVEIDVTSSVRNSALRISDFDIDSNGDSMVLVAYQNA